MVKHKIKSTKKPQKQDVWVTEARTKKKLPQKVLQLIKKYEKIEESEE